MHRSMGGGCSEYIMVVGVPWHTKKRGVLGAGTAQKGGLRYGHNPKGGGVRWGTAQ